MGLKITTKHKPAQFILLKIKARPLFNPKFAVDWMMSKPAC